jgi:hypothetical protein
VGRSGHCCDHCSNSSGRLGLCRSDLVSIRFTRRSFPGPRRDDLTNYWAHRPFVRSFILLVDSGDIRPPHQGTLKKFLRQAENEFELRNKKIRSDNGTKFKKS